MTTTVIKKPSFSMIAISLLQIVLLCTFCRFGDAQSTYNNTRQSLCPREASVDLVNATRNDSGYFFTESGEFFPTHATREVDGARRGCICDLKPCLALCPPEGADTGLRRVTADDDVNYAAIPEVLTATGYVADALGEELSRIFVWDPCPGKPASYSLSSAKYEKEVYYYLLDEGSLYVPRTNVTDAVRVNFGMYCLQLQSDNLSYAPRVCYSSVKIVVVDPDQVLNNIRYISGLVAVPFVIATVIVYSILPELRNIHGTSLRCYLCCHAVTYIAFAVDRLPGPDFDAGPWCLFLGFFIYFSFIASILWLNVVCIDLWWRLGGYGSLQSRDNLQRDRRKFLWYSVYVWGISVLMTAICILMEFHPDIPASLIHPGFRKGACWFKTNTAKAVYYSGPTGLIILCNICLFISTSIKMCQHEKIAEHNFETGESRRHNHNKQWFGLHLKLFILMGICWSTDTISGVWDESPNYWIVTDVVNALQGLLIFLIFVCKKNIWHSLNERYGNKKPGANWCCHFGCFRTPENPSAP